MIGPLLADINAGGTHRNEVIELLIDHQRQFLPIVGSLVAGNRSCSVHGDSCVFCCLILYTVQLLVNLSLCRKICFISPWRCDMHSQSFPEAHVRPCILRSQSGLTRRSLRSVRQSTADEASTRPSRTRP